MYEFLEGPVPASGLRRAMKSRVGVLAITWLGLPFPLILLIIRRTSSPSDGVVAVMNWHFICSVTTQQGGDARAPDERCRRRNY